MRLANGGVLLSGLWALSLASRAHEEGRRRLIKTEFETIEMTDEQVQGLVQRGVKFMDITHGGELRRAATIPAVKLPQFLDERREEMIRSRLEELDKNLMKKHLKKLTSFRTRYYKSRSGREASEWLYRMIKHLTKDSPMKVTVKRLIHSRWPQFSVLCRIESPDNPHGDSDRDEERVVLSAHLDSINLIMPKLMPSPGADDDGSGTVTHLEVLRLLSGAAMPLSRPVEFMFFSAEEAGLLGSQSVVRHYQAQGISAAVLHIDMDGYVKPGSDPGIGLIMDNTDEALTGLLHELIERYTDLPVKETRCGYACSDHYSWHIAGYPAAALFEGYFEEMSPYIHTTRDTVDKIDFDHMAEFVRVALAYALHMTDPQVSYV